VFKVRKVKRVTEERLAPQVRRVNLDHVARKEKKEKRVRMALFLSMTCRTNKKHL
jgi:hypothetical protein